MTLPMPLSMTLTFKRFLLPFSLLLAISGCGITDWFGEAEAPPLPGERIAILAYERGLRPDPSIAHGPARLPARSEARRGGKDADRTCRTRWAPSHSTLTKTPAQLPIHTK